MNYKELFEYVTRAITIPDTAEERAAIARILIDKVLDQHTLTRSAGGVSYDEEQLQQLVARVNRHEPVQYVVGEAWFYGYPFRVNPAVLIPRPETEELVSWVLEQEPAAALRVWDAATGSGCVAVSLARMRRGWQVYATDVSPDVLAVAKGNADRAAVAIHFLQHDLAQDAVPFTAVDLIVSNPPYIALHEKATLAVHVREFEPALALFAPPEDPLFFYRRLIFFASHTLQSGGRLYVEINEQLGAETTRLFVQAGFAGVALKKDLSGKDRMICARRSGF